MTIFLRSLLKGAGLKWVAIVALVLAVGLTSWLMIRWFQEAERDSITIEIQDQTNEKRRKINDAVKVKPDSDPDDATRSLQYLRDRQSD